MKKYQIPLFLGRTKRVAGGFGSTGSSGNKFFVRTVKDQVIVESASMSINDKVIIDSDISNSDKVIIDNDLSESNSDDSLLLLFCISETFFIALTSFVCGYCVGYYFYKLVKPRIRAEEEIINFF